MRFITEDPYWNPNNMIYGDGSNLPDMASIVQSTNMYAYCINNPMSYVDPSGELAISATLAYFGVKAIVTLAVLYVGSVYVKNNYKEISSGISKIKDALFSDNQKSKLSSKLGRNMENNGSKRPGGPNWHAHHIIPFGHRLFDEVRSIAEKAGVDLNSHFNGVWLKANYHLTLHCQKYADLLKSKIEFGMSKVEIIKVLDEVRIMLENGWSPK